jgi:calcium/calmodulin-dependent protein kinase I
LKPENLLLSDPSDDAEVKLADFGLSRLVDGGKLLNTCCGTLTYVAPEVLMGTSYEGKGVDMWATGVITYIL